MGSYFLMDFEINFGEMKNVLEVGGGDGCITNSVNVLKTTELYT